MKIPTHPTTGAALPRATPYTREELLEECRRSAIEQGHSGRRWKATEADEDWTAKALASGTPRGRPTITAIEVVEILDPHGIGDSGPPSDEEWADDVCRACETAITELLEAAYPEADVTVTVRMPRCGESYGLTVSVEDAESVGEEHDSAMRELVKRGSELGFKRACSGEVVS